MALTITDIKTLYQNVLQREASDVEAQAWATASQGPMTDAQVRASIYSSGEAKSFVNPVIRLYEAAFGRVPDKAGLDVNVDALHTVNGDIFALANAFVSSPEFAARFNGGLALSGTAAPTDAFIRSLYLNALGRAGTDSEVAGWKASGQTVSQILIGFSESNESIALTNTALTNFLDAASQGTAAYTGPLITIPTISTPTVTPTTSGGGGGTPASVGRSYALTAISDTIAGNGGDDTISGTAANTSAADTIDGGAGTDTLNLTSATHTAFVVPGLTVSNVEIANVTSDNTVNVDTRGWTGLTNLNVTATESSTIKASATTAIVLDDTQVRGAISIDGGSSVNVTARAATGTDGTTGTITIGHTDAPTGAITVTRTTVGIGTNDYTAGAIETNGGTKVAITQIATNTTPNHSQTNGAVTVKGGASTTEVTVNNSAAVSAGSSTGGVIANAVTINDQASSGSSLSSAVGTITKINVDGYTTLSIQDNALADLNIAHGSGNIIIDNSRILSSSARTTTLNLTVNGLTGGTLDDADIYTRINVTTTGADSTLANITDSALTTLAVSGTNKLTLTSTAGLSSIQSVTVTGQAGLTANLSGVTVTAIDTSGTTGTSILTMNGSRATFAGGIGKDIVTLDSSASSLTKDIALGGGDDSLVLGDFRPTATTIDGGAGTDTLSMSATSAATASYSSSSSSSSATFASAVTGFEHLTLTGATNQTIDLTALGGYNYVQTAGGNGLTLSNLASGGTLVLDGAGTAYTISNNAFASGLNDVLNLELRDSSGAGVAFASTGITASGVEAFNIKTVDGRGAPSGSFNDSLTLLGNTSNAITVSGNAGLTLTATGTALTSVDASGITLGGFTFTAGALANAAVIKGSATGTNTIDFSPATGGIVTYTGGSGNDSITASNGKANIITLGGGNNSVTGAAGNMTITGGSANDTVTLTSGNNEVKLGEGTNSFTATSGNNIYIGGGGVDTVVVGGGVNTISTKGGADVITISAATTDVNTFSTITDAHVGAKIGFAAKGSEVFSSTAVTVATQNATLRDFADAAINGKDGSTHGQLAWFQYSGDTYIVETQNAAHTTFADGSDFIVKLTGNVDLSTATVSSHALLLQ